MRLGDVPMRIFQHAWFVKDVRAAARTWAHSFGAGPFFVTDSHKAQRYFRYPAGGDAEADVSYAFGYSGDLHIQFIQQNDDQPSIYRSMFRDGEEGFHHVGVFGSGDFERDLRYFTDAGLKPALEMWALADVVYFDARDTLGFFVELHGATPAIEEALALQKQAHLEWDGDGDPLRVRGNPPA